MLEPDLVFLKLGGSLITEKSRRRTPRLETLQRLADEIASVRATRPSLRLLLGHGSGSFGHAPARKYGTRQGVHDSVEWRGFAEVWYEAAALNRLVLDALVAAALPAVALSPLAMVIARDGKVAQWNIAPLEACLKAGLLPVIQGDVIFDIHRGGTILSTEDLFLYLVPRLMPSRVLLAGSEAGVWRDFPVRSQLISRITPDDWPQVEPALGGAESADVTGGMASKVAQALQMVRETPGLIVQIFSGKESGNVQRALLGEISGTLIHCGESI